MDDEDLANKSFYKYVKRICEHNQLWKRIDVWDKAKEYFNWKSTHSVKYSGYLLNHTKKLAVDIKVYYKQSKALNQSKRDVTIDLLPVLTETSGGMQMALFDGASFESTEELDGAWCGDLLQIVEELPKKYQLINCCFAEIWSKARYCLSKFGTDKHGYILKNKEGEKYQCVEYNVLQQCGPVRYVKVAEDEKGVNFVAEVAHKKPSETIL